MQAYAAVKFADACLRSLRGDAGVVECAFVASQVCITALWPSYMTHFFPHKFHMHQHPRSHSPHKFFTIWMICITNLYLFRDRWLNFLSLRLKYGLDVVVWKKYTLLVLWMSTRGLCFSLFKALSMDLCLCFLLNLRTTWNRVGLDKAKKELAASIQKGVSFIRKWIGDEQRFSFSGDNLSWW